MTPQILELRSEVMTMYNISLISDEQVTDNKAGFLGEVAITQECTSLSEFAAILTEFHICCGVFTENKRNKSSFQKIQFLQFDFDNGTDPEYVISKMGKFSFVLAASKNHLKDKGDGKGIIPRFHLFIPLLEPITDSSYYSFVIETLGESLSLDYDRAAKDCSRYFVKHSDVLRMEDTGLLFNADSLNNQYESNIERERKAEERFAKALARQKKSNDSTIPLMKFKKTKFYREMLAGSLRNDGGRNAAFMSLLGTAKKCGVDKLTAIALVCEYSIWGTSYTRKRVVSFADSIWTR